MRKEEINPEMDLIKTASDQPGPIKKVSASASDRGSDETINPEMDLVKSASGQPGPGGNVAASSSDRGNDETTNPDMNLIKGASMGGEPQAEEKESAKMPDVGTFPTGKQAVKKTPSGHGLDE